MSKLAMDFIFAVKYWLQSNIVKSFLLIEIVPKKNLFYFCHYLNIVNKITQNHDQRSLRMIKFMFFIITLLAFKSGLFYFYPFTDIERYLLFDAVFVYSLSSEMNFIGIILNFVIFIFKLYLVNDKTIPLTHNIVQKVFIERDEHYFPFKTYKKQNVCSFVCNLMQFLLNIMQFFLKYIQMSLLLDDNRNIK